MVDGNDKNLIRRNRRREKTKRTARVRESLVLRSVASIRDSLGPISKELLGRLFRRRIRVFLSLSRILRFWTDIIEKGVGFCFDES